MITYKSTNATAMSYGENNDCAVRATSVACNISYKQAHAAMVAQGRKRGQGTTLGQIANAVTALGFQQTKLIGCPAKTVGQLHKYLDADKKYFVEISGHILAFAKGNVEDWTGERDKPSRHRVTRILEVTPLASKNSIRKAARYAK